MQVAAAVLDQADEAPAAVRRIVRETAAAGRVVVVTPETFAALAEALGPAGAGTWVMHLAAELGRPVVLLVAADDGDRTICIAPPGWDRHDTTAFLAGIAEELSAVLGALADTVRSN